MSEFHRDLICLTTGAGEMICFTGRSAEGKECGADEAAKDFGGGNSKVAWAMKM